MTEKVKRGIPKITNDRLDNEDYDTAIGEKTSERHAYSFIKGREKIQAISLRLPISMYKEIREIAFKTEDKINQIIIRALREYLKCDTKEQ